MLVLILSLASVYGLMYYQRRTLSKWRTKRFNFERSTVESGFLDWSPELRSIAIDFAWHRSHALAVAVPITSTYLALAAGFTKILGWLSIAMSIFWGLGAIFFSEKNDAVGLLIFCAIFASFGLYMLRESKKNYLAMGEFAVEDSLRKELVEITSKTATEYIRSRIPFWFEQAKEHYISVAKDEYQINADHSFGVYSTNFSDAPGSLPSPKVALSLFFSNGSLSVVSNIWLDLREASLTLINSNDGRLQFSKSSEWAHEEFHYQDVVQVSFVPRDRRNENSEWLAEGEGGLILELSSGTKKEYPATRAGIASLQTVVRRRVRVAKEIGSATESESTRFANNKRFCTKCGSGIRHDDVFCGHCGAAVA